MSKRSSSLNFKLLLHFKFYAFYGKLTFGIIHSDIGECSFVGVKHIFVEFDLEAAGSFCHAAAFSNFFSLLDVCVWSKSHRRLVNCQRLFVLHIFAKPSFDLKCCFNRILTISFFSGVATVLIIIVLIISTVHLLLLALVLITKILPLLEINRRRQFSWKLKLEPDCIVSWLEITLELEAVSSVV